MKRHVALWMIALAALVSAAGCCSTCKSKSSDSLQGKWSGHETGNSGTCTLAISGNKLDYQGAQSGDWCKGTFTLNQDASPKQLVGVITDCESTDAVGKVINAIYKIENGTLTVCGNSPGDVDMPASFNAPGSRTFVLTKAEAGH
jgi:uncharacterized protein (TIGR03067 family)